MIHMRDAKEDTIDILKAEGAEHGIIHCFTEDWETAKQALDLGFYISFSGIVSFKSAQNIKDAAKNMPRDRLLIETDSPYLAPKPFRGKRNEPAYLTHIVRELSLCLDMNISEISQITSQHAKTLFRLK